MKAKILLLILFSGLILSCCKSKSKMTTVSEENRLETNKVTADSLTEQRLELTESAITNIVKNEQKNEISGDILIKGKSDLLNPFIYHHRVGNDTVQSISIVGNAEYSISNYYVKGDEKKSETVKKASSNIFQNLAHHAEAKEMISEKASSVSEEIKKTDNRGFQVGTWVVISVVVIILILVFFTYKYLKK